MIEVWSFDGLGTKATKVVVTLVIGEDENDVERFIRPSEEAGGKKKKQNPHSKSLSRSNAVGESRVIEKSLFFRLIE